MRQEFLQIVKKLKSDPFCAISVIDDNTMNKVLTTTLGSTIVQRYGSVENYFEQLKNKGVVSFSIQEYKKNGSGWKNTGNVIRNLTFSEKHAAVNPVQDYTPVVPPLNGMRNEQVVGLGFYEAASLMANSQEKTRLEEENKYIKEKNERLEKEVLELKEEKLKREYDASKSSGQNEMLLGLVQNLPAILSGFKSSNNAPSLNGVTENMNLSPIKNEMIDFISQKNISDDLIHILYTTSIRIMSEEGFADQFQEFLNNKNN